MKTRTMAARCFPIVLAILLATGCAHNILIGPDAEHLPQAPVTPKMTAAAGYFISDQDRQKVVVTPGGGGDKISYSPYKDLEPGIYHVLSNYFERVYTLKSASDANEIQSKGIHFIFIPSLGSQSSSSSIFTWPPTDFTLNVDIKALDNQGKVVWQKQLTATGHAEFSEFKHDFPLAAKRAGEKAFQELQDALASFPRN